MTLYCSVHAGCPEQAKNDGRHLKRNSCKATLERRIKICSMLGCVDNCDPNWSVSYPAAVRRILPFLEGKKHVITNYIFNQVTNYIFICK